MVVVVVAVVAVVAVVFLVGDSKGRVLMVLHRGSSNWTRILKCAMGCFEYDDGPDGSINPYAQRPGTV